MNRMALSLSDAWALAGIALVALAVLTRSARVRSRWLRVPFGLRAAVVAVVVILAIWPAAGFGEPRLTWAAQLRGIVGDFSATAVVVAILALALRHQPTQADRRALALLTVAAGSLLVTLQLGSDRWDLYRLGYVGWTLPISAGVLAAIAAASGWSRTALSLAAALLVWGLGWPESGNLWEALLDPWWVLWCCASLAASGIRRMQR